MATDCVTGAVIRLLFLLWILQIISPAAVSLDDNRNAVQIHWQSGYNEIVWRNNCPFSSGDNKDVAELEGTTSAEDCGKECLNHPTCNHFNYYRQNESLIQNAVCNLKNWIGEVMMDPSTELGSSKGPRCGFVLMRIWQKSLDDDRILVRSNCSFPSSTKGRDVIRYEKSFISCRNACLDDHRCNAFSYDREDSKCVMPHQRSEYESHLGPLEINDLFRLHPPTVSLSGGADCAVVSTRNSRTKSELGIRKNDCDFALPFETKFNMTADDCELQCFTATTCNYFSHDGTNCFFMFELELVQPIFKGKNGWTCGYDPNKIWNKSSDDKRILFKSNCTYPSSSPFGSSNDVSNETSFSSCQSVCLEDYRCNAFSYNRDDNSCVMPHKSSDFKTSWTHLSLSELFRLRVPLDTPNSSQCAVVLTRNWKVVVHPTDDGNSSVVLYQDDCDFNMAFNIEEPQKLKSLDDCVTYCFNVTQCTHFSYNSTNSICRVKKAPALTGRLAVSGDKTCGYIPDRLQQDEEDVIDNLMVYIAVVVVTILLAITVFALKTFIKHHRAYAHLRPLLKGSQDEIDDNRTLDEQAQDLPYDKRWEFPINRLRFGNELGSGVFGRVVKAEAEGLKTEEQVTTVAVKMVRSHVNATNGAIESLIGELKILVYLGAHVNVVNLLGACTKRISRGELYVIVEYCRFGNLRTFLRQKRKNFENHVDPTTGALLMRYDHNLITSPAASQSLNDGYVDLLVNKCTRTTSNRSTSAIENSYQVDENPTEIIVSADREENQQQQLSEIPEWGMDYRSNDANDGNQSNDHSISTRDLMSWSIQIARGMDYLVKKKVLHGDLATRNILLADDGVVRVADYGLARQFYNDYDYIKHQPGLLPVKWMAIESLNDWVFSSQSDVWSFGVVLWEIFTLGKVPYAGLMVGDEFIRRLEDGYRMEKPEFMPQDIGRLMAKCWKLEPHQRPTFSLLTESLGVFMEATDASSRQVERRKHIKNNSINNSQNQIKISVEGGVSPAAHVQPPDSGSKSNREDPVRLDISEPTGIISNATKAVNETIF